MTVTDNEIYNIIIDIMDIQNEPENIFELDNWIREIGLQEVYKKNYTDIFHQSYVGIILIRNKCK